MKKIRSLYSAVVLIYNKHIEQKEGISRMSIRKAKEKDLSRIAEIFICNNRINYFPIFKDESYSFGELQVVSFIDNYLKKRRGLQKSLYI